MRSMAVAAWAFMVETRKSEFPCQFQWQNYQAGQYALGIEPSTNHVLGKPFAQERGELIWLEHGEERSYTTRMAVLDGADAIAAVEQRIRAIALSRTRTIPSRPGAGTPWPESMEFSGRTILFTGAAGGLGTESALTYMAAGARVLCVDIDEAKIAALRGPGAGGRARQPLDRTAGPR